MRDGAGAGLDAVGEGLVEAGTEGREMGAAGGGDGLLAVLVLCAREGDDVEATEGRLELLEWVLARDAPEVERGALVNRDRRWAMVCIMLGC